jgi:hypothetical protein
MLNKYINCVIIKKMTTPETYVPSIGERSNLSMGERFDQRMIPSFAAGLGAFTLAAFGIVSNVESQPVDRDLLLPSVETVDTNLCDYPSLNESGSMAYPCSEPLATDRIVVVDFGDDKELTEAAVGYAEMIVQDATGGLVEIDPVIIDASAAAKTEYSNQATGDCLPSEDRESRPSTMALNAMPSLDDANFVALSPLPLCGDHVPAGASFSSFNQADVFNFRNSDDTTQRIQTLGTIIAHEYGHTHEGLNMGHSGRASGDETVASLREFSSDGLSSRIDVDGVLQSLNEYNEYGDYGIMAAPGAEDISINPELLNCIPELVDFHNSDHPLGKPLDTEQVSFSPEETARGMFATIQLQEPITLQISDAADGSVYPRSFNSLAIVPAYREAEPDPFEMMLGSEPLSHISIGLALVDSEGCNSARIGNFTIVSQEYDEPSRVLLPDEGDATLTIDSRRYKITQSNGQIVITPVF